MRVIAGSLKGRRLKAPTWDGLRPTSDKLRETLFNILAPRIARARMLDACAGTGAVGIEALSRGAQQVVFVEQDPRAQALIAENLAACGISNGYTILGMDVRRISEGQRRTDLGVFDVVFLDPPYALAFEEALASAGETAIPGGVVVLEHARRQVPADRVGWLVRTRTVRSGDSELSFYERQAASIV